MSTMTTQLPSRPRSTGALSGRLILLIAAGAFTTFVCIGYAFQFLLARAFQMMYPPLPTYDFDTTDLLLAGASLPSGWRVEGISSNSGASDDDWAQERTGAHYSMYDEDGNRITEASVHVWRYRSPTPRYYEFVFSYFQRMDPPPSYITFTSQYADKWEIRCTTPDSTSYACVYFASYDEFLVSVWIDIAHSDAPEDLLISPEEINTLLAAQDQRMADFLNFGPKE